MKRSDSVRVGSVLGKAALLLLLGGVPAAAQDSGPDATAPSPDPDDVAPLTRTYFAPYPDDQGAIPFEALSPADQEGVMLAAENTDYGPDVHAAWSAYTHEAAAAAVIQRAAYQSGIEGLDSIGVVP